MLSFDASYGATCGDLVHRAPILGFSTVLTLISILGLGIYASYVTNIDVNSKR